MPLTNNEVNEMKRLFITLGIILVIFLMMDVLLTYAETHGLKESDAELLYLVLNVIFIAIVFFVVRKQNFGLYQQVGLIIIAFVMYWGGVYALNWFVLHR